MAAGEVRLGDIGTDFEFTIKNQDGTAQDISAATTKQIIFKKPDLTTSTKTAVLVNTGTDGKMKYKTISGDLDQIGAWSVQARVVLSTDDFKSDIATFSVHPNL